MTGEPERTDYHIPTSAADAVGFAFTTRAHSYLEIVLAEDWFLYCEDQDGLMWVFNTECWQEWEYHADAYLGNSEGVFLMAQYAYAHEPRPLLFDDVGQMNRRQFDAGLPA